MMIGIPMWSVYCPCTALTGLCPVPPQPLKQNCPHVTPSQGSVPEKPPQVHSPGPLLGRPVAAGVLGA